MTNSILACLLPLRLILFTKPIIMTANSISKINLAPKTGFDDVKDSYSIKRGIAIYKNNFKKIKIIA